MRILRMQAALEATGAPRTALYDQIAKGHFTRPVKLAGRRAAGWPEEEVQAILSARVAGAPDDEIHRLVDRLHELRLQKYAATACRYLGASDGEKRGKP